jgi:hypothetical protein
VRAAADDPAGFRLLFHHAAREPEFRQFMDQFHTGMTTVAHKHLAAQIPNPDWAAWAAQLVPTVAIAAVTAWLDAGQPDPDQAADRIHKSSTASSPPLNMPDAGRGMEHDPPPRRLACTPASVD